jgi:hypothetical protein
MRTVPRVLLFLCCAGTLAAAAADTEQAKLENELRAEIARLREQAARAEALLQRLQASSSAPAATKPAAAPAAQPAAPAPAPAPVAARPPGLNAPPKLPASNPDNFTKKPPRIDLILMGRYDAFDDTTRNNTFFLRKAELGLKGNIAPGVDFSFEYELARTTANDPYRRTYIRFSQLEHLHVKVGMEKAPIGLEELASTGQIPFVDRSEVSDRFSAAEELGVFLESNWSNFMFQASITNGGRRLYRDDNRRKDLTARAVWAPHPWLSLGVATLRGENGAVPTDRNRDGFEVKFGPTWSQGAQAEYFRAKDGRVRSDAYYLSAYWAFPVKVAGLTHVQPVARYEWLDRSDDDRTRELNVFTTGFSLFLKDTKAKLQFNWLHDLRGDRYRKDEYRTQAVIEY